MFFLTLGFINYSTCYADEYESTRDQFKLSYDSSFVQLDFKQANVVFVLRNKAGSFPTFNIVLESVSPKASKKELKTQEKELVDSYSLAGFMNVKLRSSELKNVNGQEAFVAELEYSINNTPMIANVAIISSRGRGYILTFIDFATAASSSKPLFEGILTSFTLLNTTTDEAYPAEGSFSLLTIALVLILTLSVVVLMYKKFFK